MKDDVLHGHGLTLEARLPIHWVPVLKSLNIFHIICNPRTYYTGTWASRVEQVVHTTTFKSTPGVAPTLPPALPFKQQQLHPCNLHS